MICVPVSAATTEAALDKMARAYALADLVELRLDGMAAPDLPRLLAARTGKIVCTNRRRDEGGRCALPEKSRVALLLEAAARGADYVDIEARTDPSLRDGLFAAIARRGYATEVILSRHLTTGTPGERALRSLLRDMMAVGAPVIKLVCLANRREDNLRVLRLLPWAGRKKQRLIAFAMGEQGRMSRVAAPLLGSFLAYASLERGEETASGQLTVSDLRLLLRTLEGGDDR